MLWRSWMFWGINSKNSTKTAEVLCWEVIRILRILDEPSHSELCSNLSVSFLAAVAEIRDSPGAPGLQVLPGLGDGPGRHGLVSDAGHQSLWTERLHTEMGGPLLLTPSTRLLPRINLSLQQSPHCTTWRRGGPALALRALKQPDDGGGSANRSAVGPNAAAGRHAWTEGNQVHLKALTLLWWTLFSCLLQSSCLLLKMKHNVSLPNIRSDQFYQI